MTVYRLGTSNEKIHELIQTKKFQLSVKIMKTRIVLGLSLEDAAQMLGLTKEDYFDLEWCEEDILVENNEFVLTKLQKKGG